VGPSTTVEVAGRTLALSNLQKVLYPECGFTKGEVIDYYAKVAGTILPYLAARPVSMKRYPDGVASQGFFAKNAPNGTPEWVRTVRLPAPGSTKNRDEIDYVIAEDLPTVVWMANLAAIELHVPQWKVGPRGKAHGADLLVFDLDPGPPASIVECFQVALWLRDELAADGLTAYPKTSGSKGMQLYAPIKEAAGDATSVYAKALAQRLEKREPELIVSRMVRSLRPGKVLIDWSQNNPAKTTVAPYSLRARPAPTVSTPLTWEEVEAGDHVQFTTGDVLARIDDLGDLFAPLLAEKRPKLP
jgi:bifunctional non-homologous end joining protein LigD